MRESFICALSPGNDSERRFAFCTSFGIPEMSVKEECGISKAADGCQSGCRVPRVELSIHCYEPHLETSCHVLRETCRSSFKTALPHGTMERAILVTPKILKLGDSGETYPIGKSGDLVVTAAAILESLDAIQANVGAADSLILRISSEHFEMASNSAEIMSWPYLTLECAMLIHNRFRHYRTNAPSLEPIDSQGGMWAHCAFFGIDEPTRVSVTADSIKRTVGELFYIPLHVCDGCYILLCPYIDMGLDCALTVPLLYSAT